MDTLLTTTTVRAGAVPAPTVSADTVMAIAEACRRRERLRFDYTSPRRGHSIRSVEPHGMVSFGRHWYLVAWDTDRTDWRTFRVDRLTPRTPNGPQFTPRELPDGDVAAYLARRLSSQAWPFQAVVTLHEPPQRSPTASGPAWASSNPSTTTAVCCTWRRHPRDLAWMITSVDADFTLTHAPPELADALRIQGPAA